MPDLRLLLQLEHKVWQSVIDKNGEALAQIFTEDYIEITVDGKSVVKQAIVEQSPIVDNVSSYEIIQAEAIELDATSAILTYHLVLKGDMDGRTFVPKDRWATSVWRYAEEQWKCCFFQQTGLSQSDNGLEWQ